MYKLSRVILLGAASLGLICACVVSVAGWPYSAYFLFLSAAVFIKRRRAVSQLTTLGSARWANISDLRAKGMVGGNAGLILGRTDGKAKREFTRSIFGLFARGLESRAACNRFFGLYSRRKYELVRLPNAIHTAVFSPSGGGKGVSLVVPFLRTSPGSCVVIDFKGENATLTAGHRRKLFGQKIVMLDPFKVVTQTPDSFNPLQFIDKNDPQALDACRELAREIVLRSPDEKEPHWADSAEMWIGGMIAVVVCYGSDDNGTRSLQTVREILSSPPKLETALKVMIESKDWGGLLARMGGQLMYFVDKEKSSALTTVGRHLRFLDSSAVIDSTATSSFNPVDLRTGKMSIFLVLPPDQMRIQSPLLRLWVGCFLRAVVAGGLQERNKVHFVLDEAASLGHLDAVDDAVDKYRAYGVRLQFYFQSLGQLKKCFPNGQDQTLLSNTTQIFFGVNDQAVGTGGTADFVSARLGEKTIVVGSGGDGTGTSVQRSNGPQHGGGNTSYSRNTSRNWQQQTRRLLRPEEVCALPPRTAITFVTGMPPIRTTLLRYYEEPNLGRPPGRLTTIVAACRTLTLSILVFIIALFVIALVASSLAAASHHLDSLTPARWSQSSVSAYPPAPRVKK